MELNHIPVQKYEFYGNWHKENPVIDIGMSITGLNKPTPKDAMKLRMTGFECSSPFVIRLAIKAPLPGGKGWGPPLDG